jgi:uncharacterized protein YjaG (DUF416 family)
MLLSKRIAKIKSRLIKLNQQKSLVFGALICKRLIPNYQFFSKKENFGNDNYLLKVINIVIDYLTNNTNHDTGVFKKLDKEIDTISPDSEEYPEVYSTYALNACIATQTLLAILQGNIKEVSIISEMSIDTITIYVEDTMDIYIDEDIDETEIEILYNELNIQMGIIQEIETNNIEYLTELIKNTPMTSGVDL